MSQQQKKDDDSRASLAASAGDSSPSPGPSQLSDDDGYNDLLAEVRGYYERVRSWQDTTRTCVGWINHCQDLGANRNISVLQMLRDLAAVSTQNDRIIAMLLDGGREAMLQSRRLQVENEIRAREDELHELRKQHIAICDALGDPQRLQEHRIAFYTELEQRHGTNLYSQMFDQNVDRIRRALQLLKEQEKKMKEEEQQEDLEMDTEEFDPETDKDEDEEEGEKLVRAGAMRRDREE